MKLLTIRDAQIAILSAETSRRLLAAHAREAHRGAAAALGATRLKQTVDAVVDRCGLYGVTTTREQLRLMDLAMTFGADWQRDDTAWLDEILRDRAEPDARLRVRKAWRAALRRLAHGP